jgi:hypothetical protein
MINNENIGKNLISALDSKSLFSQTPTFYDKWCIFRFIMTYPEDDSSNLSVELRKYRLKSDGNKEFCDQIVNYSLDKKDPEVANAINSLIRAAIEKGVELNHFRH